MNTENPTHSAQYIERFQRLADSGFDLFGEARFVDAMLERKSYVIDAGCGPGRSVIELAKRSHRVIGLDMEPLFIAEGTRVANQDGVGYIAAEPTVAGRARFLPADITQPFPVAPAADLILCSGHVITFLDGTGPAEFLSQCAAVLAPTGRVVTGFGLSRGYSLTDFDRDLAAAGLVSDARFATWQLAPFQPNSNFVVDISSLTH